MKMNTDTSPDYGFGITFVVIIMSLFIWASVGCKSLNTDKLIDLATFAYDTYKSQLDEQFENEPADFDPVEDVEPEVVETPDTPDEPEKTRPEMRTDLGYLYKHESGLFLCPASNPLNGQPLHVPDLGNVWGTQNGDVVIIMAYPRIDGSPASQRLVGQYRVSPEESQRLFGDFHYNKKGWQVKLRFNKNSIREGQDLVIYGDDRFGQRLFKFTIPAEFVKGKVW